MKLRHIEVFHALMNARTMTEAAEHLNVSQPAVSMVLRHAEQYLGFRLFDRAGGRLTPTPEAIALIPDVDEVFDRIQTLSVKAQRLRDASAGMLTITVTPSLMDEFLPPIVAAYSALVPKARLVTRQVVTSQVLAEVLTRRAELGFILKPAVRIDSGLAEIPVAYSRVHCVMPATHELARRNHVVPADLASERIISVRPNVPLGAAIDRAFGASDLTYAPTVEVTSSLAALPLVGAGVGLALVESDRSLGRFPGLAARPLAPEIETCAVIVHHRESTLSRLARVLVDRALDLHSAG
jgi:DNA-binding transcriptional LysR family regulator